jgi:8-oxo-dGTP pyrophosphatase MutT (NUDIX family)
MKQIYKVFLNDRVIKIGPPLKSIPEPLVNFNIESTEEDIRNWFNSFVDDNLMKIYLVHPEPSKFFKLFSSVFLNIDAAGGAVISGKYLLVIFRNGKWDLPKGKINKGENPEEAALREVSEECGISGQTIVKSLPSTFHVYKLPYPDNEASWIFKETYWFEMSYNGCMDCAKPQVEEGITLIKWVSSSEINEIMDNTYENLKQIIELYT